MRKVTAGLFSSIDGVVQAPNEWQPAFDDEMGAALSRMLKGQDAVLLGRVTFAEWAGYWPTSTDEPFAGWINTTPKYVASTTLDSVDHWSNSTLIKGSVADFVAELRRQQGGTIGTAGSPHARSVPDRARAPRRAHPDDQPRRRRRRAHAIVPRRCGADQLRSRRGSADEQWHGDRHLPSDPIAPRRAPRSIATKNRRLSPLRVFGTAAGRDLRRGQLRRSARAPGLDAASRSDRGCSET